MKTRHALSLLALLAIVLGACTTDGGSSPGASGSPAATPTPIAADVASPADAAALVIATDPRFEGAIELTPDVIGGSKYWEATALDGGAYQIVLTIGWGDCPSGCINKHTWTFRVTADGQVTLLAEAGDEVPAGTFPTE